MEEDIDESKEKLLDDVDVESTEAKTSEVEQSDEESLVDESDEDIEDDSKDEDAIEIVESKDGEVSDTIVAKILNKARNITTEQILTILAISVLVFSAITGILAQTFNEIDQEATSYEMKASEYASEARTIESMENQIILREEILLMETKNLAMQNSLYEAEVELLNSSMSKNTDDYNKAKLAKDIFSFYQNGIIDSESVFAVCAIENACTTSAFTQDGILYEIYSFESGVNESVDSYISIFSEVRDEYGGAFIDVSTQSSLELIIFEIGYIIDDGNQSLDLYILTDNSQGMNGMISSRMLTLAQNQEVLLNLENEFDEKESLESTSTDNWITMTNMRNTYSLLLQFAELTNDSENRSLYQQAYDHYDFEADYELFASEYWFEKKIKIGENISVVKDRISSGEFSIIYLESVQYDSELERAINKFEKASDDYENYLDSYNFAMTGMENSQILINKLLDESMANSSGNLNSEGEFNSDELQQLFYDEIHKESADIYEESKQAVQEAEKVREKASSVSTSVMFVSIGNVTLGIAGGMVSSAKYGLGNLRSIGVLLGGGVFAGLAGAINSLSLIF
jgi:hypothetical protein